jgi:hypothetical protein
LVLTSACNRDQGLKTHLRLSAYYPFIGSENRSIRRNLTQNRRRAIHGGVCCWVARIVSLLPGAAATLYVSIEAVRSWMAYGSSSGVLPSLLICLVALLLPSLVAWRQHGPGGTMLVCESSLHIMLLAASIVTHHPYAYFELDRSFVLHAILPFWTMLFVGGWLHLISWGNENRQQV